MSKLPNYGVEFCLGYYKIEVSVLNPGSMNRNFVIESEHGVRGLYHRDLMFQIREDINTLEKSILDFVAKARVAYERQE